MKRRMVQRGSSIDPDVRARTTDLLLAGHGPAATLRQLEREFPDRAPSHRWVKSRSARLRAEPSEPWRFMTSLPGEAAAVLPVIDELYTKTAGRATTVTKAEANVLRRVREAIPHIAPWPAYLVARQLLVASPLEEGMLMEYLAVASRPPSRRRPTEAEWRGLLPFVESLEEVG
jgi:hypothetical protein